MKTALRRLSAVLLSAILMLPNADSIIAYALEDPMDENELSVPESLADGGKWYFIRENMFSISETSDQKLYIPIQRTGNLDSEGEVALKIIDVTARHDVNYKERIYRENPESEIELADMSLLELTQGAAYQEEYDPIDEQTLGEAIDEQGGADLLDAEGNTVGTITAEKIDENGEIIEDDEEPVSEEPEAGAEEIIEEEAETAEDPYVYEEESYETYEEEPVSSEPSVTEDLTAEESDWTEAELSETDALRKGREQFTGTVSDRQELANNDQVFGMKNQEQEEIELVQDAYPGKTYTLHFDVGESVKYLVITPLYSTAADGDGQIMLTLKNPGADDEQVAEDFRVATVVIKDEDESQPVKISMADDLVIAEGGKASLTVTREGRINDLVGVHLTSWGGSAVMGDDYSGIGADLYFPMGITSRTVELPVGYGEEEKDFYVTLSTLTDAELDVETSRVVIPGVAGLMAESSSESDEIRFGEAWNLRDAAYSNSNLGEYLFDGLGFKATTPIDKENVGAGIEWHIHGGYFYDGFRVNYLSYLNFCNAETKVSVWENYHENGTSKYEDNGGVHGGENLTVYYEGEKAPDYAHLYIYNRDNEGTIFNDSYARLETYSVEPILRKFKVTVTDGRMADGSLPDFNTNESQTAVILNDGLDDSCTIWGNETFSISQLLGQKYTRLIGIDAVNKDGKTYRIAIGNGTSQTLVAILDENTVNDLAAGGYIEWTKGTADRNSKIGNITVRPVFEYVDARVEVKESQYGEFYSNLEPSPTMLWDFNSDEYMSACMGKRVLSDVSYKGAKDEGGNDYYTFTATAKDPRVSISLAADNVEAIQWVKVRAKTNSSQAEGIELFGHGGDGNAKAEECARIEVTNDGQWHTYIVNIPEANMKAAGLSETAWNSRIDFIRLDPIWNKAENVKKNETIDIDYIAFFPSQEAAEAWREDSGENGYRLAPGLYNFHIGQTVTLRTELSEAGELAGVTGDGIRYNLYTRQNGEDISRGTIAYANGSADMKIRGASEDETRTGTYYRIEPTFTQTENQIVVQIAESDLDYFNTAAGVLNTEDRWSENGIWNYRVAAKVRSNEVFELQAETLDETHVPVWTGAKDNTVCSGNAYYMMSGVFAEDNVIRLSVDTDADAHAYYNLKGSVYAQIMNLATSRPSDVLSPGKDAMITAGMVSAIADDQGDFDMPAIYLAGNTTVRYTVTYNGNVSIREAKLAPAGAKKQDAIYYGANGQEIVQAVPVSLNTVAVDSYSVQGAHFTRVDLSQSGVLNGVINTIEMNGKKVTITVHAEGDQPYTYNNQQYTEHITDVTLYFQSQKTREIHGLYSTSDGNEEGKNGQISWDENTKTATLTFEEFTPGANPEYDVNDVLMLQLRTDKKVGITEFADMDMIYDPVSSGIVVTADYDYEPQSIDFEVPEFASLMQVMGPDESGTKQGDTYSFGRFPFLGEVNIGLKVLTVLVNRGMTPDTREILTNLNASLENEFDDLDTAEDISLYESEGINPKGNTGVVPKSKWGISVAFTTKKTYYGGIRFSVAVVASRNFGSGFKNLSNPYKDAGQAYEFFTSGRYKSNAPVINDDPATRTRADVINDYLYNDIGFGSKGEEIRSMFGGSRFTISLFAGIYIDFGYMVKTGEKDGELMVLGSGGFFGGSANYSYTFYTTFYGVPIYITPEADLNATFYLGMREGKDITLEQYKNMSNPIGNDIEFTYELQGHLSAGLSIGVGIYKVLGFRVGGFVGFDAGYGNEMSVWFPHDNSNFGYATDFTASGTLDLIITDVKLYSMTFPLPWSGGWMKTFNEVSRAKTLLTFVRSGIEDGKGSEEARNKCQEMADELQAIINDPENLDADVVYEKFDKLRNYAYDTKVINFHAWLRAWENRQEGVIGSAVEEALFDEGVIGGLSAGNKESSDAIMGMSIQTRDHTDAKWVGERKSLFSTFKPVEKDGTTVLESSTFEQTSPQILSIGNNRYLMTYLTDNAERDRQMAGQLVYTIYDASNNSWTTPVPVQNDSTADGKPHLTDAGDKVILTWASIPDEKYQALKDEIAEELTSENEGEEPTEAEILYELEDDPVRVMKMMEVYAVNFDKSSESFGAIDQLTDDAYYDDNPQAVYDSETGDYIVMYYKTGSETDEYDEEEKTQQLLDIAGIGADPEKTYSLLCYMLYNNQTETPDTRGNTHEPGWARDYLFPKETTLDEDSQEIFLAAWKGQRFLPSPTRNVADPAIGDMTVSEGYNGLAAFAFTVDTDYDLSTAEDKELYMQFYDFSEHGTYVPIRIAGEHTVRGVSEAVDVGTPKLVRNGGSTWLFWRENGMDLRYLNVSELLNAKVSATSSPGEDDWTWAVQPDGTFAADAVTGEVYEPNIMSVEFGSMMTDTEFNGTEYNVISDKDDNLYVVWSANKVYQATDPETGEVYDQLCQEIYASSMIREETSSESGSDGHAVRTMADDDTETDGTTLSQTRWSKPNRLTTDSKFNDGLAAALDDDGGLIIVHNQYEKKLAKTKEEIIGLLEKGEVGLKELDGVTYVVGSFWYNTPTDLVVTHCAPAGSVEATAFSFSHNHPVPGETIRVSAAIENTGMAAAEAYTVQFYESKDGERGDLIYEYDTDEKLPVNYTRAVGFLWEVPEEGVDGYSIEAVITEKKADGTAYEPESSWSDPFLAIDLFDITVDSIVQNGDAFDVTFTVTNTGNLPAGEGITAKLYLAALYGDIKERYGMDDDLLVTEDISGLEPRDSVTFTESIELPLSVFEYCGYDAINGAVKDTADLPLALSADKMFGLEYPIHLSLNDGNDITLNINDEQQLTVGFETDALVDVTEIVYSVDDTSVASIDENGVITALGKGITTITATLMPSGRTITVTLTVLGENGEVPEPTPTPSVEPEPTPTPAPEGKPADDKAPNTYDSWPVKYLFTGAGALLVAIMAFFLRLKNRK